MTDTKPKKKKALTSDQEVQRRDFLKVSVAAGIGACALGAPVVAAVRLLTAPVFVPKTEGKFYSIAPLDSLTERPQPFTITAGKQDAWMTVPQQTIGTLFLRRTGETVQAFQALCPHAGCLLRVGIQTNPQSGAEEELFYCPCRSACFDLDGNRLDTVSSRNMDSLNVKIEAGQVYVQYEDFLFGLAAKKAM